MRRVFHRPVVGRLADLENRLGEVETRAQRAGQAEPSNQAKKDDKDRGWIRYFSRGQIVAGCLAGMLGVGTTLVGVWTYLVRAPHVELAFDRSIHLRWVAKDGLSFDCNLLADNTAGSAGDTLHLVRAELTTESGKTMNLRRVELRDGGAGMAGPFFVVKERQSVPVRLTVSSAGLSSDVEQFVRDLGEYTLTLQFTAQTSRLARPAQSYCFYLGKNVADYLFEHGAVTPDADDQCALRSRPIAAAGDTRGLER